MFYEKETAKNCKNSGLYSGEVFENCALCTMKNELDLRFRAKRRKSPCSTDKSSCTAHKMVDIYK